MRIFLQNWSDPLLQVFTSCILWIKLLSVIVFNIGLYLLPDALVCHPVAVVVGKVFELAAQVQEHLLGVEDF